MQFDYFVPTKILFGKGQFPNLHSQKLPGKKALIAISSGKSTRSNDYLSRVEMRLDSAGVSHAVFDKVLPSPIKSHVMEGAALARSEGCDFVVGLGGGSNIDAAKAITVVATNGGGYWDYISGGSGQRKPVPNDPLPIVAITTVTGTGTEADPWTVTTKEDTSEKIGFGYEKTFLVFSIVDSDLMLTMPPHLAAYQGSDALFHSTEGYLAKTADPISDLFVLKAIELVDKSLAKAVADRTDEATRADVALANTLSDMVESLPSCTSEHSLGHALSAFHHELPHGAGLIMISKTYCTHFANTHACDERMITMAKALGKTNAFSATDFVQVLCDLQSACSVAEFKMSDYGIDRADLEKYADNARQTTGGLFLADPVRLSREDSTRILQESFR